MQDVEPRFRTYQKFCQCVAVINKTQKYEIKFHIALYASLHYTHGMSEASSL